MTAPQRHVLPPDVDYSSESSSCRSCRIRTLFLLAKNGPGGSASILRGGGLPRLPGPGREYCTLLNNHSIVAGREAEKPVARQSQGWTLYLSPFLDTACLVLVYISSLESSTTTGARFVERHGSGLQKAGRGMPNRITIDLIRRKAEHNEGLIHTLEELSLHQVSIVQQEEL